uniref:Phosphoglycerate mutase family protein n=1 Tax=Populus alba TaxID=43335 RepID=A0A4U5NKP2_POPAL|nr:hypothetical protein D5086_0000268490 [Populus alba]
MGQVDAANFNIDGHFPVRELWGRAGNCWNKILAHESRSVLVVAHNAVNQALVATAIDTQIHLFAAGSAAGRKTSKRIILVSHGTMQGGTEATFSNSGNQPMSMLGIYTAYSIAVQEAADCLGADCVPPDATEVPPLQPGFLNRFEDEALSALWEQSGKAWPISTGWDHFHLDAGSISVLDFPDGPTGSGTIRCINYTAHLGRWSIPITRSTIDDEEF